MKSFVSYPFEFEKILYPENDKSTSGRLIAHYELFKKVSHLKRMLLLQAASAAQEGFTRFALFRSLITCGTGSKNNRF